MEQGHRYHLFILQESFSQPSLQSEEKTHHFQWHAGLIQRFSLGFRGPICLVCGFTDVKTQSIPGRRCLGGSWDHAHSAYCCKLPLLFANFLPSSNLCDSCVPLVTGMKSRMHSRSGQVVSDRYLTRCYAPGLPFEGFTKPLLCSPSNCRWTEYGWPCYRTCGHSCGPFLDIKKDR